MRQLQILLFLSIITLCQSAVANVSLPAIFTDNMVLQRDTEVRIWGWAKPLEKVAVQASWSKDILRTVADKFARWEVMLPTPGAGGPFEITVQGYNQITLRNVLVGEVWLCSGQSNMEFTARQGILGGEEAMKNADQPNIRFFTVHHRSANEAQIDLASDGWKVCSPETMAGFSAAAYFFAKKLQEKMGVPVGLIHSGWGGTPAEAWVAGRIIEADPLLSEAANLLPDEPWGPQQAGSIYHAMIAPLTPFKIAGTIWYQGETNVNNPLTYKELFSTLIKSWRTAWGYEFPFYFAQIAPFKYGVPGVGALVRDAQRRTLEAPNTGMVVTSDIGDTLDIHPKNKLDLGLRFANLALKYHYHVLDGEVSGPLYRSFEVEKDRVKIFFDHASGLKASGGDCPFFEVAGEDGIFYPAKAEIGDGLVMVFAKQVKKPKAVRFAWRNTATPNLFNGAGLPTSCFWEEKQP